MTDQTMAEAIKETGLPSVKYFSEDIEIPRRTLLNWFRKKRGLFDLMLDVSARKYRKKTASIEELIADCHDELCKLYSIQHGIDDIGITVTVDDLSKGD